MKKTILAVSLMSIFFIGASASYGESVKHFQLSLFNPVQIYDASTSIHGVRLSIYGENQDVFGGDFGIVSIVNGEMKGWQYGFVNFVKGPMTGYQEGIINVTHGEFVGWQSGAINISKAKFTGFQSAFFNKTQDMHGVQFGLINLTDSLYGIQIGIANIINSGKPRKFFPIVNFAF